MKESKEKYEGDKKKEKGEEGNGTSVRRCG